MYGVRKPTFLRHHGFEDVESTARRDHRLHPAGEGRRFGEPFHRERISSSTNAWATDLRRCHRALSPVRKARRRPRELRQQKPVTCFLSSVPNAPRRWNNAALSNAATKSTSRWPSKGPPQSRHPEVHQLYRPTIQRLEGSFRPFFPGKTKTGYRPAPLFSPDTFLTTGQPRHQRRHPAFNRHT